MARNGSGVYSLPAGSVIANGDTSDAADLNVPLADLEADMNTPRPIVAGGTGADNAADARANLGLSAVATRTIAAGNGVTVTNGDGVSGNPTVTIANGTEGQILRSGASAPAMGAAINRGTSVTASGTSVDFTGIPSWARRVTIMFQSISTNGTSPPLIQLGTSSGATTSGYSGGTADIVGATAALASAGFQISTGFSAAAFLNGSIVIENITGNDWVARGTFARADAAQVYVTAGSVALSGVLDRVRITTLGGVNTFDAGTLNVSWE